MGGLKGQKSGAVGCFLSKEVSFGRERDELESVRQKVSK